MELLGYNNVKPILRWAGGKQKLVKAISKYIPNDYKKYFEPFFGGGSLFFTIRPQNAILSDINHELIECYKKVKNHPQKIDRLLRKHKDKDCEEYFLYMRKKFRSKLRSLEKASLFIYLNKAAFNGIYRVNKKGEFNVPYGPSQNGPAIPNLDELFAAAEVLKNAKLYTFDFEDVLKKARKGDFIYFDPPYPPQSKTANFTHYTKDRFTWNDQIRLSNVVKKLSERKCLVLVSNVNNKEIINLYSSFKIHKLEAVRWLGSNGDRYKVTEILIKNY